MNLARADALAARSQLDRRGWITSKADSFRHLPPPAAVHWLAAEPSSDEVEVHTDGWSLIPLPQAGTTHVEARWLDAADPVQRAELLAELPAPAEDEAAPFAWAHRALMRRALRLRIDTGEAAAMLHLRREACNAAEAPLLLLELLPGARCVLLETHVHSIEAGVTQNLQLHVRLGEGARLQHLRVASPSGADRVAHHLHARLASDACYEQALLAGGSAYHLQRSVLELQGERAQATVGGVLLAHGTAADLQVQALHHAPHTRSAVEVLALAGGAARLVANARTHIAAGCDEADTRQRLAGIPTAGQPRIVLRPHLEILHDRVHAAHGATWGALPEEALFLARQRGLDETAARSLILQGLARAALARAVDPEGLPPSHQLDALLAGAIAAHLAGGRGHG